MSDSSRENNELETGNIAPGVHLLDSKTSQLDDVLNEKLERAFHKPTSQVLLLDVAKIASEHDPIDLAYAVTRLPTAARFVVYENLPDFYAKTIFIINTGRSTRTAIFRQIEDQEVADLVGNAPPDEAVDILDDISDRRMRRVLGYLEPKRASRVRELQKHDRNSAGRLMTNEFFAFDMNSSIGEVAKSIRDNPGIELTRRIFVLNENGELAGFVPERNLIVNPDYLPLRQVMRPVLHTVVPDASRDEVVDIVERYKISTLPVVDDKDHLIGVISYVDVVEAMEDIADETIASIAGTGEDVSEHEPTFRRFMWRVPWLIVTLCAGLTSAAFMSHFSTQIWWFAFIPFFIPLITGMSGNVGLQCSAILVRGMSTGELSARTKGEAIAKELSIGLLIGIFFGVMCGSVVYAVNLLGFMHHDTNSIVIAATVGFGLFGACMTATTLGSFSPFFFVRLGIDPAVSSGPIVTAFNDVLSSLMFYLIARMVNFLFLIWV